ncbi:MAG: DUF1080 domain-containing protein [Bacteroidales bacterium]|jgi:hypothetical protein|nr:DUF1080 domain-containing protein [Bacteroidales bacterium]
MKIKYIFTCLFALSLTVSLSAQDNRTVETKIADLLAQLPARSNEQVASLINQYSSLGEDGIARIAALIVPSSDGSDLQARYAISSLARYAGAPGNGDFRAPVESALLAALAKASNAEVKDYFIRELAFCGGDATVTALGAYLNGATSDAALSTLTTIGTDAAARQILAATTDQPDFIKALGELKYKPAEEKLLSLQPSKQTLSALASIGSAKSLKYFQGAVKAAGYRPDANNAVLSYLQYATELSRNGNQKLGDKIAKEALKNCTSSDVLHYRSEALELLGQTQGFKLTPTLLKEIKSDDKAYRQSVLNIAKEYAPSTIGKWSSLFGKSTPELQTELLSTFGSTSGAGVLQYMIAPSLTSGDASVRQAAITALSAYDKNNEITIPYLSNLLINKQDLLVDSDYKAIEQVLLNKVTDKTLLEVAPEPLELNNDGRAMLLRLAAARATPALFKFAQSSISSQNADVKAAAFAALAKTARADNTAALITALEKASKPEEISSLQNTLINLYTAADNVPASSLVLDKIDAKGLTAKLVPLLPYLKSGDAQAKIASILQKGTNEEKDAAAKALVNWQNPSVLSLLYNQYRSGSSSAEASLGAYLRLLGSQSLTSDTKLIQLEQIMSAAKTTADKSKILQAAAQVKSLSGLLFVSKFLDDSDLSTPAAFSAMKIALPTPGESDGLKGDEVKSILTTVKEKISGEDSQYYKIDIQQYIDKVGSDAGTATLSKAEAADGFELLFNGKDLDNWVGNKVTYTVEDGVIVVAPKKNDSGYGNLMTAKEYANFVFRFEFQLTPAANNGIGIRAPLNGDAAYSAMEIQILDCEHPVYKDIKPYQHHGSIYGIVPAKHGAMKPVGEWNSEEIRAEGTRIKVTLNGKVIVDADLKEATKNGTADHNNHPGLFNPSGHIGFLGHGSNLKFRNIRIKELK